MARSVNKVILIGNLTRDPELRYTPQGHAVSSFVIATNRDWLADGERKESTEFHNIVSWNKLAELCAQLLSKGAKTYVEGRLQTRDWIDNDGNKRYKTEIVIDEMIVLTSKRSRESTNTSPDAGFGVEDADKDSSDNAVGSDANEELDEALDASEVPF